MDDNSLYNKYIKYKVKYNLLKNKSLQKETFQKGGNENKPDLYLFKAKWCGHCKNFLPTWEALSNKYNKKINFITYDSEKNKKEMEEWKIEGFPTIIYRKDNVAQEYKGDRDIDSLINFIESI